MRREGHNLAHSDAGYAVTRGSVGRPTRRQFLGSLPGLAGLNGLVVHAAARPASDAFDVCVVGSGPAGAILACRLVEGGMSTVLLEGGFATPAKTGADAASVTFDATADHPPYPIARTRF